MPHTQLEFVIGAEKRIADIVSRAEIEPLLRSLVKAGPHYAAVLDEDGLPICRQGGDGDDDAARELRHNLLVEGEPKGTLQVFCGAAIGEVADGLTLLARDALQLIITNNLKRMLTTEVHTAIVQESYDQLVETNRKLVESEKRYRELAVSLEQQVEARTADLQKAYSRMLQQEKLAAVGSLAAGMAHEINNPNGFVRSNLNTFGRYLERLREMLNCYQLLISGNTPLQQLISQTEQRRRELKIDFVLTDSAELLRQSLEGVDRIAAIVADLKSFSHVDDAGPADADLNLELERTLSVLDPQMAGRVTVVRDLQPLPPVACQPGLIDQALLTIMQNALLSRNAGLELRVSSRVEEGKIVIRIADNGCGMSPEVLRRVFEPFFTTREVGSGTGMGLTVAREIIAGVGGSVELASVEGEGTTVSVLLPLPETAGTVT